MTKSRPFSFSISFLTLLFVCCSTGYFLSSSPANAKSFWDAIVGRSSQENGPPPEVTLQAPFVDPSQGAATSEAPMMDVFREGSEMAADGNTLDLRQPHRSPEAIAEWSSSIVVEALTFSTDTFPSLQTSLAPNFSAYGLREYNAYLEKSGLLDTLKSNHLKLLSISEGSAQVLREGLVSGTYHWLVQVQVLASFYDQKLSRIVDKRAKIAQNQNLLIQVQVGRTSKANANKLGIEIERWVVVSQ